MFIYAYNRALSLKNNIQLQFDIISGMKRDTYQRKPLLNYFKCDFKSSNLFESLYFPINSRFPKIIKIIFPNSVYLKESNKTDQLYTDLTNNKRYFTEGYWQCYTYIIAFENILRADLQFNIDIKDDFKKQEEFITKCESVSIHFRRKDYDRLVELSYYYNAISIIKTKTTNPKFFIFSDDPDWVKNNFRWDEKDTTMIINRDEINDFYLMSKCKHHIISNSTFAWWASWLSKSREKIIIAPPLKNWPDKNVIYPEIITL